jgi:hypothetical protein
MYEGRPVSSLSQATSDSTASGGLAVEAIPSNIPYQGQYGFQIGFEAQPQDTNAVNWTYSQVIKCL